MKISNFEDNTDLEDIRSLQIIIKAVPYEKSYLPVFVIMSPEENYPMSLEELNSLMDGVEIARSKLDEIINFILKKHLFSENEDMEKNENEGDENDLGSTD